MDIKLPVVPPPPGAPQMPQVAPVAQAAASPAQAITQGTLGIDHLKKAVHCIMGFVNALGKTYEHHWRNLLDAQYFTGPMLELFSELGDIKNIEAEVMDLSDAEAVDLLNYASDQFSIPQEKAQDAVRKALSAFCKLYSLYQSLKGFGQV